MLEDALTDRDLVHRQTASVIVKHLALGVAGLGCEDTMLHLMNLVWPNCFETSPHVIGAVMEAVEAMRVTLGPGVLLSYTLQGLFHPARKVREVCRSIYTVLLSDADLLFDRCTGVFTIHSTWVLPILLYHSIPISESLARGRTSTIGTHCRCSYDCSHSSVVLFCF